MTTPVFREDLKRGLVGEQKLYDLLLTFEDVRGIQLAGMPLQRQGIDAIVHLYDGDKVVRVSVEVKTDFRAEDTQNLAVEYESVHLWGEPKAKKRGWLYTSRADFLVVLVPTDTHLKALWFDPQALRRHFRDWPLYQARKVDNGTYYSAIYLLPLHRAAQLAERVCEVPVVTDRYVRQFVERLAQSFLTFLPETTTPGELALLLGANSDIARATRHAPLSLWWRGGGWHLFTDDGRKFYLVSDEMEQLDLAQRVARLASAVSALNANTLPRKTATVSE